MTYAFVNVSSLMFLSSSPYLKLEQIIQFVSPNSFSIKRGKHLETIKRIGGVAIIHTRNINQVIVVNGEV